MWIMTAEGWKQLSPKVFTPAPRGGIFRPQGIVQARCENGLRIVGYENAVMRHIAGEISLEEVYRPWAEEVTGAFGEVIR